MGQARHQIARARERARATCVVLVVHDEHGHAQALEGHRRHRPAPIVAQDRGREHDAVRTIGTRQLGRDERGRLRATARADQPHRRARARAQPCDHGAHVGDVPGRLAKTGEKRRRRTVRGRVDDRDRDAALDEQRARAHEEVAPAPARLAIIADAQPAMPAGEQDRGGARRMRVEHEQPLRDPRACRQVDDLCPGLRRGRNRRDDCDERDADCVHRARPIATRTFSRAGPRRSAARAASARTRPRPRRPRRRRRRRGRGRPAHR